MTPGTSELLRLHFEAKASLTLAESEELLAAFEERHVKKKLAIIQPGFVATHRSYVAKGAFRAYVIDKKRQDQTIQFAIEDWWISDYNSYIYQKPATMFVEALEGSVILQVDYESEQRLKKASHTFETLFRMMAEKSAAFQQRKVIASITQSAEERYYDFLEKYPAAAKRLPQYALASYLGMTTEFLSKIRNNKLGKKS